MASQSFTTKAGVNIVGRAMTNLGNGQGYANSVVVTNSTSQWCTVGGVPDPIPPWAPTAVYRLSIPTNQADVRWVAPTGIVAVPVDPTQTGTFTWYEDELNPTPPQGGFSAPIPQSLLGTFITTANSTKNFGPFTLPTGTQSVMVVWKSIGTTSQPFFVGVFDDTNTKLTWGNVGTGSGALADTVLIVPVSTLVSPSIIVQVTENPALSHQMWVVALPYPSAVAATLQGSDGNIPVFFPNPPSVFVNNAAIIPATANSTVGSFAPGAGLTAIVFNLFDTVGHRYLYEWSMDCWATGAAAGGAAMFMSIKGHTSGASVNVLCASISSANFIGQRDSLRNVLDVQFWLNPLTDPKYDITVTNNSAVGSSGTSRLIYGPTLP